MIPIISCLSTVLNCTYLRESTLKGHCHSGEGTLVISGSGCATGTLEPLAYTRARILLSYTRVPQITPILDQLFSFSFVFE